MTVENINAPAGDTQTFDPRPRPAICTVATAVKPVGRWPRSLVFLDRVNLWISVAKVSTYFSRRVFVLVTTSPYSRYRPKSTAASLDSDW